MMVCIPRGNPSRRTLACPEFTDAEPRNRPFSVNVTVPVGAGVPVMLTPTTTPTPVEFATAPCAVIVIAPLPAVPVTWSAVRLPLASYEYER
jgi:hypothetical protein